MRRQAFEGLARFIHLGSPSLVPAILYPREPLLLGLPEDRFRPISWSFRHSPAVVAARRPLVPLPKKVLPGTAVDCFR